MNSSCPWSLERGAKVEPDGGVRFSVWAPLARDVAVHLRPGSNPILVPLEMQSDGLFEAAVSGVAPGTDYFYRLRGRDRPDPVSRHQPQGVHGPSRVVDAHEFQWSDDSWTGRDMADLILYELHVGTFTEEGSFEAVISHLPALRALGITAIELMPVAEFHRVTSDSDAGWVALCLSAEDAHALLAAFNFGDGVREITLPNPSSETWHLQLTTDAPHYGGSGQAAALPLAGKDIRFSLPPMSALLYRSATQQSSHPIMHRPAQLGHQTT